MDPENRQRGVLMQFRTMLRACLVMTAFWLGAPLAWAQETPPQEPVEVDLRYHLTRVRNSRGFQGDAPGPALQVSVPLNPRLRVEMEYLWGRGSGRELRELSHSDLDVGLAWRLDDPLKEGDGPLQRIHALGQWSISENRMTLSDGEVISERDEGAGVGFARRAHPDRAISHSWRLVVHPTFMNQNGNNIAGQRALLARASARFRLGPDASAELGYSYRTHKLTVEVNSSGTEQGPFFGASFRF